MINEEINAIKDQIIGTVMPKRLYLFGSFANDTYNEDSDYDFYVVVPDDAGNQIEISQRAYKSLRVIRKRPVDIVVGLNLLLKEEQRKTPSKKWFCRRGFCCMGNDEVLKVFIEEYHVGKAMRETQELYDWLRGVIQESLSLDA